MRKFEVVSDEFKKHPEVETKLPERATGNSAGYDFYAKEDMVIMPGEHYTFWTDVKCLMFFDNVLEIYTRSGNGTKRGIIIRNGTGIIDADYYGNDTTDGNIAVCLYNTGDDPFEVHIGDRIAQGVFQRYLITDDDKYRNNHEASSRTGGFGSTGD